MESYFGVTPAQSSASGHPRYDPGAGLKSVDFEVGVIYLFADGRWALNAQAGYSQLSGRCRRQPHRQRRRPLFRRVVSLLAFLIRPELFLRTGSAAVSPRDDPDFPGVPLRRAGAPVRYRPGRAIPYAGAPVFSILPAGSDPGGAVVIPGIAVYVVRVACRASAVLRRVLEHDRGTGHPEIRGAPGVLRSPPAEMRIVDLRLHARHLPPRSRRR